MRLKLWQRLALMSLMTGLFWLAYTWHNGVVLRSLTETKLAVVPSLTLQAVERGANVDIQLAGVGGRQPLHYRLIGGKLPPGLKLDERTGRLTGTIPLGTDLGFYRWTIEIRDADGKPVPQMLAGQR